MRLAAYYGVPLSLFTEPPETDEERVATYRQLALGAIAIAEQDSEAEAGEPDRDGDDQPDGKRRRRSA